MNEGMTLWRSENHARWFLVPDDAVMPEGLMPIQTLLGESAKVDPLWLAPFEITEDQARQWAKEELGQALTEIRDSIDDKLEDWQQRLDEFNRTPITEKTTLTPTAAPALLDLLKQLPGVLGNSLSGDEHRVDEARDTMTDLQHQLKNAGIDLDDRFTNFPDRLAELRKEFEEEKAVKKSTTDKPPPDKPT